MCIFFFVSSQLTGMCCKSGVMTLNYNVPMAAGSASGFTSTVQDQPAEVLGSEITSSYGVPKTTAIQSSAAMEPTASSQESQTNSMSGSLVAAIVGTVIHINFTIHQFQHFYRCPEF